MMLNLLATRSTPFRWFVTAHDATTSGVQLMRARLASVSLVSNARGRLGEYAPWAEEDMGSELAAISAATLVRTAGRGPGRSGFAELLHPGYPEQVLLTVRQRGG